MIENKKKNDKYYYLDILQNLKKEATIMQKLNGNKHIINYLNSYKETTDKGEGMMNHEVLLARASEMMDYVYPEDLAAAVLSSSDPAVSDGNSLPDMIHASEARNILGEVFTLAWQGKEYRAALDEATAEIQELYNEDMGL